MGKGGGGAHGQCLFSPPAPSQMQFIRPRFGRKQIAREDAFPPSSAGGGGAASRFRLRPAGTRLPHLVNAIASTPPPPPTSPSTRPFAVQMVQCHSICNWTRWPGPEWGLMTAELGLVKWEPDTGSAAGTRSPPRTTWNPGFALWVGVGGSSGSHVRT